MCTFGAHTRWLALQDWEHCRYMYHSTDAGQLHNIQLVPQKVNRQCLRALSVTVSWKAEPALTAGSIALLHHSETLQRLAPHRRGHGEFDELDGPCRLQ